MAYYITANGERYEIDGYHDTLYVPDSNIIELDLSGMTKLQYLYCHNNKLTKLDVSMCPNLTRLSCSDNNIIKLDLSNNPKLFNVWCDNHSIHWMDVPKSKSKNLTPMSQQDVDQSDMYTNVFIYIE